MSTTDHALLPAIGLPRRLTTAAARRWLRLRYLLTQRHRYDQLVVEHVHGQPFIVLPQVFNPKLFRSGEFLVGVLKPLPASAGYPLGGGWGGVSGESILDMGTGSGVGAVFAARRASRVVAVDINPHAVRCARINVLLNGVESTVEVREGDLFAPVAGEHFDLILFNPPYFRGAPRDPLDHAWRSLDVVERFAAELGDHLTPSGYALVVLSTDGDTPAFLSAFERNHLDITVAARTELINETLTVYQLRPKGEGQDADSL
ncbi:MAG TPA: methyltransferase [Thermomicrobiales bacterium]|nr:methyltransferase [Thermomicrobiales bacterium]